ncbi:MAG: hypothetical protein GC206_00310 [Alphaproteobacteria bacterium]|nr:hypothetical protein [Alphaproteobacteria bacterium]
MGMLMRATALVLVPPALLFSVYLAVAAPNGGGVVGGLAAALALSLYVLIFGPAVAAQRMPPRVLLASAALAALALYLAAAVEAGGAPALAPAVRRALVFVLIATSAPAALMAVFGRAHALGQDDAQSGTQR